MSTISDRHVVSLFDSKKSQPLDGQRLAKVVFKHTKAMEKKGIPKKASKCVSIPKVSQLDAACINAMNPYIVSLYHEAQDGIIRELVLKGKSEIADSDISEAEVLKFLAEEAAGTRMTSEEALEWFNGSMAELLTVAFADKLGVTDTPTDEQTAMVNAAVADYRKKFAGMAGGKTKYDKETALKMLKALEFADTENDEIAAKFNARLVKMRDAPTGADMFGL